MAPTEAPVSSVTDGQGSAPEVAPGGVLDLDHVGAEPGQQLGGERQGLHLLDRQDPNAGERCVHRPNLAHTHLTPRQISGTGQRP